MLSAILRDDAQDREIRAVTDFHRAEPGLLEVTLTFDPRDLPEQTIYGPFELRDLRLFRRNENNTVWLDRRDAPVEVTSQLYNQASKLIRLSGDTDFGQVAIGESVEHTLTIHNDGHETLEIYRIETPAGYTSSFSGSVEAGESVAFSVTFAPLVEVEYQGELIVDSDATAGTDRIPLTGEGGTPAILITGNGVEIPAGSANPNPGDYTDFGDVLTLDDTAERTFTIWNTGTAALSVGEVSVGGVHAAEFTVTAHPESSVAPGNSTTFQITFDPGATGIRSAEVSFENNDSGKSPFSFAIHGNGTKSPQSIDFSAFDTRPRRVTDGPFPLGAFANSGLPLTYDVLAGPVTVDASGLMTPTGADGAVTIRIGQPGSGDYGPADDVYVTFALGGWHPFTKLVAGWATYALRADGTLWTWGFTNGTGHLADATAFAAGRVAPQQIGADSDWTDLAIGNSFGFGLRAGGKLWAWGSNLNGQLGDGTTTVRTAPVSIGSERSWASVSAGSAHTASVAADGTLWTWGLNTDGQLGHGDTDQRTSPEPVGSASDWSRVACGGNFTLALKSNGELWAWGSNGSGQLGQGDAVQRTSPTRVGTAADWARIAVGGSYVLALKTDGTLWAWGINGNGQFGNGGTSPPSYVPVQVGMDSDWTSVSAYFGTSTSAARKADGSVWVWGGNASGQLGDGTATNRSTPQRFAASKDWSGIEVGIFHVAAWREDGTVWVVGEGRGFSGTSPRALTRAAASAQEWVQLSGNGTHFHALRADGTLWAWGRNGGAFGNGSTADAAILTQIGTEDQWDQVASGGQTGGVGAFTLAVKKDGTLWGTGSNTNSKLGLGDTTTRDSFTQIGGATNWKRAAAGSNHGMAVRADGTLWGWGLNSNGQLGLGDTTARTIPSQVGSATDWQAVACGGTHTMGIKTDGTLWAWGFNNNGRLGLGDSTQRTTPTQVGSGNDWAAVACGQAHTLALKNDGTLWVWGLNSSGQLGLGNTAQRTSPVQVGTATHWASISASLNSSAALTANGTLWIAGESPAGQLGLGTTANVLAFTQMSTAAGFQHAAMGAVSFVAIHADGSFWTAGTAGTQVLGGGRDRTAVVPVQPHLSPQSIVPLPAGAVSGRVTATSGLPVSLSLVSGPGEIDGDEIAHTGPPGSTVTFLAWQPGDERAWNAAPPVQLSLTRPAGDIRVFAGTVGVTALNSGESTVDFGNATVGATPVTRLFTIRNDGDDTLVLGEVVATGDWNVDITDMNGTLAPGATSSFTATFAPASSGPRAGGVIIMSDDPDETEFSVAFTGHGMHFLTASQRPGTKLVDIAYDLFAPGFLTAAVSLQISSDGGATWTVPAVTTSGDIGPSVAPGAGKAIVWDAGADWPGGYSGQIRFRVVADGGVPEGFAHIPGGSFAMGSTSGDTAPDAPPVSVTVSAFHMAKTETTKAQWDEVRTWGLANGYTDLPAGGGKGGDHPVQTVSWYTVVKWCNARSEMDGLTPVYTVGGNVYRTGESVPHSDWSTDGHRLPTEAEWEKAARGGVAGKRFPWGTDEINHDHANYLANGSAYTYDTSPYTSSTYHPAYATGGTPYTSPVGSFAANGYGLKDMAGNVREWCWDWYEGSYYGTVTTDPRGPASSWGRVLRGGRWNSDASNARSAGRYISNPVAGLNNVGFRVARNSVSGEFAETGGVTVDTRSDNADLSALTLSSGTLDPAFAADTTSYSASVATATASTVVTPTKTEANATIEARINGGDWTGVASGSPSAPLALNVGANPIDIRVTAQDGSTQKTYTVTVTRDKIPQTIIFDPIPNQFVNASVLLSATGGGSGIPVVFSVTAGPGVIAGGDLLSFIGAGTVSVTATQAGDDNHLPAAPVTQVFEVTLPDDYGEWLDAEFPGETDPAIIGFGARPLGQALSNGLRYYLATGAADATVFTLMGRQGGDWVFAYSRVEPAREDVAASYEWSIDLDNWQGHGEGFGGVAVTFEESVGAPDAGGVAPVEVRATPVGEGVDRLFVRLKLVFPAPSAP